MTLSIELITVTVPAGEIIGLTTQQAQQGLPMLVELPTDESWRGRPAKRSALLTLVELEGDKESRSVRLRFDDSGDDSILLGLNDLVNVHIAKASRSVVQ